MSSQDQFDDALTAQNLLNEEINLENSDDGSYSSDENIQQEKYFDGFKIVDLPIIAVKTGQEQEQVVKQFKCLLFRWREGEWKERSNYVMRFLKHKKSGKIRALMKSYKTFFIRANFYIQRVNGMCQLQKSEEKQNTWDWKAFDFSQEQSKIECFSASFEEKSQFERFGLEFNFACESNYLITEIIQKQQQKEQNLFQHSEKKEQE